MEFAKKNWKNIVIALLVLFSVNKCTQSCTRDDMYNAAVAERDSIEYTLNNSIELLEDSVVTLNTKIQVLNERISGTQQALDIQNEAARRISEAKKNISVNVKTEK